MTPILHLCPGCKQPQRASGHCPRCRHRQRSIYSSNAWQIARRHVLERAKLRCERCGTAGLLDTHHVVAINSGGAPFDPDNLELLCRSCHRAVE